jgi:hypothetical protein
VMAPQTASCDVYRCASVIISDVSNFELLVIVMNNDL